MCARSHAFIPHDSEDHTGVVFPAGLQLITNQEAPHRPSLLISYGKGDDRVMALTLGADALREYLLPIKSIEAHQYKLCALRPGSPSLAVVED